MRDVTVRIRGIRHDGPDTECVEYYTLGKYACKNGRCRIEYDDSDAFGIPGIKAVVHVEANRKVILQRMGKIRGQLVIEKGDRHFCRYGTEYDTAVFGVFGERIDNLLGQDGGRLHLSYTLDINNNLLGVHELDIAVKGAEPCQPS